MQQKYIGMTFEQEIEMLIKTLDNTSANYSRYSSDPHVLVFISAENAQSSFTHVKHFTFSCKLTEPILDDNKIIFVERAHSPIHLSWWFTKKRERSLRKQFKDQVNKIEKYVKGDFKYRRKGNVFYFEDMLAIIEIKKLMALDKYPQDFLGLLRMRYITDLAVEFYICPNIPY